MAMGVDIVDHAHPDHVEQFSRYLAMENIHASHTLKRAYIRSRPYETIYLRSDDKACRTIRQAEMVLDLRRHLDGPTCIFWRLAGDGTDRYDGFAVHLLDAQHNHDRTVFYAFLLPLRRFVRPKIGVVQHVTRLRSRP